MKWVKPLSFLLDVPFVLCYNQDEIECQTALS
jgi:hypothetical protein